jgi:hypothetical protein
VPVLFPKSKSLAHVGGSKCAVSAVMPFLGSHTLSVESSNLPTVEDANQLPAPHPNGRGSCVLS